MTSSTIDQAAYPLAGRLEAFFRTKTSCDIGGTVVTALGSEKRSRNGDRHSWQVSRTRTELIWAVGHRAALTSSDLARKIWRARYGAHLSGWGGLLDLARPRVVENSELDEQAELVGTNPFPDDPVTLEVHDVNHPLLYGPPGRRSSHVPSSVGPPKCEPEHDRVAAHDQLFDNILTQNAPSSARRLHQRRWS